MYIYIYIYVWMGGYVCFLQGEDISISMLIDSPIIHRDRRERRSLSYISEDKFITSDDAGEVIEESVSSASQFRSVPPLTLPANSTLHLGNNVIKSTNNRTRSIIQTIQNTQQNIAILKQKILELSAREIGEDPGCRQM